MASSSLPHTRGRKQRTETRADRERRRYVSAASDNGSGGEQGGAVSTILTPINMNPAAVRQLVPERSTLPTALLMGAALLALELTNAATTWYALDSLIGSVGVYRASFAILLTFGLTTLDAGGVYRLFHPATAGQTNRSFGLWAFMGAWLLCATTNAIATWYTISLAIVSNAAGTAILSTQQLLTVAPVFLALGLWLMRLMLVAGWAQGERG